MVSLIQSKLHARTYCCTQSKADVEKEAGVTFDKYILARHRHKVISGVIYLMDVMNLSMSTCSFPCSLSIPV